jgi:hypothetical protein
MVSVNGACAQVQQLGNTLAVYLRSTDTQDIKSDNKNIKGFLRSPPVKIPF